MTSKSPARTCEDADEAALSYAEIKALCAGDPHIKERMELDVEVAKLRMLKSAYQSQQFRLEDNVLHYFPEQIRRQEEIITGLNEDMQLLEQHPHPVTDKGTGFSGIDIQGRVYTDRVEAGEAIMKLCRERKNSEPAKLGSYRGFQLILSLEDFGHTFAVTLQGRMSHRAELGDSPGGNLLRMDNALMRMPDRMAAAEERLKDLRQQLDAARAEGGKPFPQEEELRQKSARLTELDVELNLAPKQEHLQKDIEPPRKKEIKKQQYEQAR